MCGIVGVYHFGCNDPVDPDLLSQMNDQLIHRGPDDDGVVVKGKLGMAMRRLAIIDLQSGHQPMSFKDERYWIVFNGEIYNFLELKEDLIKDGYTFRTTSDTEVLVALYDRWGTGCLAYLRGMFAFAIWDSREERLFIARDRLGKKPLYYSVKNGRLIWGSEIQALLRHPYISRDGNLGAIDLYLGLQYVPSPLTAFADIKKLPPAHFLIFENGSMKIEPYWDFPTQENHQNFDIEIIKEKIKNTLIESVRLRMIAEVPLGAFLSGGIDSSLVVGLMAQLSSQPIKTFSIGFKELEFSELAFAHQVAKCFSTNHTEFVVEANMVDVLPKLATHYGDPYGDSSCLPSYFLAKETRQHVTVALNGDGGDENFGGYNRYSLMKKMELVHQLPSAVKKMLAFPTRFLHKEESLSFIGRFHRFGKASFFTTEAERYLKLVGMFADKKEFYSQSFKDQTESNAVENFMAALYNEGAHVDFVNRMLRVDFKSYISDCLMPKMDIATMANSLEVRSPLLDHKFVELVFGLPGNLKLKGLSKAKWLLKETFQSMLPKTILTRPKMGFGIPLGSWFRKDLKHLFLDRVLAPRSLTSFLFDKNFVKTMFDQHQKGHRDHGFKLWTLLMLEIWYQEMRPVFPGK